MSEKVKETQERDLQF